MPHFTLPGQIVIGPDALKEAENDIKALGTRAFLVTGKHVGKSPMMEQLKKVLEDARIAYCVFDKITGEPTDDMICEGTEQYKKSASQFCIGIGGGSSLDAAKAIAAMSVLPGKISDYAGVNIEGRIPAIVAIPTTAGTGSEATKFTIVTDTVTDTKLLLKGEKLLPCLAIVNTDFSLDMPRSVTASTGLDALTHAVEAYTSRKAFQMTDLYAISAVKRIMRYLPAAYQNGYDAEAREQMAIAALEAGICINNSSVTIVHGMSRPIGALFHVQHGMSNAILLSKCLRYAAQGAVERFAELGYAIGAANRQDDTQEVAAERFLQGIEKICRICEVPTWKEYGIDREKYLALVPKMAEDAIASGSPANTRRQVTKEDCMKIYYELYQE